ncbi:MAG TPA: hypothetical protein VM166_08740, partial [Gemmatimonadaceae bacterium]|nr:hypothetical protein [Gemmatimonadaceae bacterium]
EEPMPRLGQTPSAAPRPVAPPQRPVPVPTPATPRPVPVKEPAASPGAFQPRETTSPGALRPGTAAGNVPTPAAAPRPTAVPSPATGEDRPSTQFVPPAGIQRGAAGAGANTEDTKKHDEARRFARLLVSEIKLYNEPKVQSGRKSRDLYERLKDDIDRSRQMYDERISEEVRKASNYFYDELVRILADGDADALGL